MPDYTDEQIIVLNAMRDAQLGFVEHLEELRAALDAGCDIRPALAGLIERYGD